MNRTTKQLLVLLVAASLLYLCGCVTPLSTSVDVSKQAGEFDLSYDSDKDVFVERRTTTTNQDGSVVEEYTLLRSEASSAARAQAEREIAVAEAHKASIEALNALAGSTPVLP